VVVAHDWNFTTRDRLVYEDSVVQRVTFPTAESSENTRTRSAGAAAHTSCASFMCS